MMNNALMLLFWLQHSIMARAWFKEAMHKVTDNQYYYLEKGLYSYLAGICIMIFMIFHQPVDEIIVIHGSESYLAMMISLTMQSFGAFMAI